MSNILSPHPPIRILITLDKQTGAVTCNPSEPVPILTMVALLAQLISQFVTDAAKTLPKPEDKPDLKPSTYVHEMVKGSDGTT